MKSVFRVFSIIITLFLLQPPSYAQWLPVHGMDGDEVHAIVVKDSMVFITTYSMGVGAKKLTDSTWFPVLNTPLVYLDKVGNYVVGYSYYLYRSGNQGQSWDTLQLPGPFINLVVLDTRLFAATMNEIKSSSDFGNTWQAVNSYNPSQNAPYIYGNDSTLFAIEWYHKRPIYFSNNGGMIWDSLPLTGLGDSNMYNIKDIFKYQSNYWLSKNTGIFHYDAIQKSWYKMTDTLVFKKFHVWNGVLYGCGSGVYQLNANWNGWIPRNTGLDATNIVSLSSNDSVLYSASNLGPYKTNSSLTWQPQFSGLHGGWIYNIASNQDEVWVASNLGVFKSVDNGYSFIRKPCSGTSYIRKIILTDSVYYAIGDGFYTSYDYGESWSAQNPGLPQSLFLRDVALGGEYLFLIQDRYLYKSAFSPIYWEKLDIVNNPFYWYLAANDSTVMISRESSSLLYYPVLISHDEGTSFDSIPFFYIGYYPCIKFENDKFFLFETGPLYVSNNDGTTWDSIQKPTENFNGIDCSMSDEAIVYTGYSWMRYPFTKIYITYNQYDWTSISDNLYLSTSGTTSCVKINGERILLGMNSEGLWYRDDLLTGAPKVVNKPLEALKISPNPAQNKMYISVNLNEPSTGQIEIFDRMGKCVMNEKPRSFPKGINREVVDVSNFTEGFYIVSLILEGKRFNQKLIISR